MKFGSLICPPGSWSRSGWAFSTCNDNLIYGSYLSSAICRPEIMADASFTKSSVSLFRERYMSKDSLPCSLFTSSMTLNYCWFSFSPLSTSNLGCCWTAISCDLKEGAASSFSTLKLLSNLTTSSEALTCSSTTTFSDRMSFNIPLFFVM